MTLKQRLYRPIVDKRYLQWAYRMTGFRVYGVFSVEAANQWIFDEGRKDVD